MNKEELKEYRFNHLGGQWYINTLKDLFIKYEEMKKHNEDTTDIINEYLYLENEYKEREKWVRLIISTMR